MSNQKLANVTKSLKHELQKRAPEILMGIGIVGMISTTVLAVQATPKALKLIEAKKKETGKDKLTIGETIKATYKCYIPSVAVGVTSTACLIGSSRLSIRRSAALATAYKLAETAHREYREKVIETIGEKKEEAVRDKVAKEKLEKNPVNQSSVIITNTGNTLCFDAISGRYFRTNTTKIEKAVNEINRRMVYDMYVSLNDFYELVGLPNIKMGDDLGWNLDQGIIEYYPSTQLSEDNEPCLVIDFSIAPKYDYYHLMR